MRNVDVVEIFSSIQGEAKYVGARQLFVRFCGCNLHCTYCDTTESFKAPAQCLIEKAAGSREFVKYANPLAVENLAARMQELLGQVHHHSVSFTGGEPLLQADIIHELRSKICEPFYLETNGTLTGRLEQIIDDIDIISMDIKLPGISGGELWKEHKSFLQTAIRKEVFVKLVIAAETSMAEFMTAVDLIAAVDKNILLILQPVTPFNGCTAVSPEATLLYQETALKKLTDVRVIPQTHKFINQL